MRRLLVRETTDLIARSQGATLPDLGAGAVLAELMEVCGGAHQRPPAELSMIAKALLNLDEVARTLDPSFVPQAALRLHARELFQKQTWNASSEGHLMRVALEPKELALVASVLTNDRRRRRRLSRPPVAATLMW